jgi:hypothetical protein
MKHKTLWLLLIAEAAACVVLTLLQASLSGVFSAAMAFPFEQIGLVLRSLSLSGIIGDIAAWLLYIALSLSPALVLLILLIKRRFRPEDALLGVLSAVLFAVLYLMTNPAAIARLAGDAAMLPAGKAVLGVTAYSVLCGYLVLKLLRLFFAGGIEKLGKYMAVLLYLLNLLFVYLAFGACFGELLDSLKALSGGNTGSGPVLPLDAPSLPLGGRSPDVSYVFLVLQYAVNALPYILNVFVVFAALRLLDEMRSDRYSQASVAAAERLSRLCGAALAATVLAGIAFNVLQLIFSRALLNVNSTVQIPVLSIAFVLAVLLLARFIAENKRLKDDNDLFV